MKEAEKALLEMKDTSELMLDLAYSSLIYHNKEIAVEVHELEEKTDKYYDKIIRNILESKENSDPNKSLILIKMADAVERIADAALDIADVVLRDIELHPVIKKSFQESEIIMVRKQIEKNCKLDGKRLGEIKLASETGMWVIAIKRGNQWKYGPDEKTKLKAEDIILARGPEDSLTLLEDWTRGD